MKHALLAALAMVFASVASADGNTQLYRSVSNHLNQIDGSVTLPRDLPAHDLVAIKFILDDDFYDNHGKVFAVKRHLQKVEKFGTASGTVFGLFRFGGSSN